MISLLYYDTILLAINYFNPILYYLKIGGVVTEEIRSYRRRGTPDLPIAVYLGAPNAGRPKYRRSEYHPEVEISQVVKGSITMQIGGVTHTFHKGDIFIITPNTVHSRRDYSDDHNYRTIVFSTDAIRMPPEHFFQKEFVQPLSDGRLTMPAVLQPGHPCYDAVSTQMEQLDACRIYEKDYKQKRLSVLMSICLGLMPHCQIASEEKPLLDPGNEAVKLCMRYIHNHHGEKLTLQTIADYCHLHPNYLCSVFKQYTGETAFEYLTRFRVEAAASLLTKEDLPIGKVAELSGFRSECLFYKKFKQIMGITPNAYKKQHAKKQEHT